MHPFAVLIKTILLFNILVMDAMAENNKIIFDSANGSVLIPNKIENVITIGAVPVLSSYIFSLGKGDAITNALPGRFKNSLITSKLYDALAPNASKTSTYLLDGMDSGVNVELLLKDNPQIVFTMDSIVAKTLRRKGLNVASLQWREEKDIKKIMLFLGEVMGVKSKAIEYNRYVDQKLSYVQSIINKIPSKEKKKILYFDYKTMTTPHLIVDWWIMKAGGISLSDSTRKIEKFTFSAEQIIIMNPDIIVLSNPNDVDSLYKNTKFSTLNAVKNRQLFVSPHGMHLWAYRTSEQPLMVLWAAKTFYPEYFNKLDIREETKAFYEHFVKYKLSDQDLTDILQPTPSGAIK
ncbi:ABC transporter substrate-binding protein [Sulfuricurvum sp.]|uniref:ABC transporter substrate-binding protein n=1 Tax=Sulfuricurvum sp. TaxID=2025608 RepID=UPI002627BBD7|nr:ABC transporter substrate-binding protein [Sulfuricurvum sp.]MDD3597622.1 ABC transporter substrate-binding protein [Sulfuricurvum sp.]